MFRQAIWGSMLDADMNARYWGFLTRRYYNKDKYSKIFLAAMASGTVASWGFWANVVIIWKVLSAISALIAISLPIVNYQKLIESIAEQKREWTYLKNEYESLWLSQKTKNQKEIASVYKKIKVHETIKIKDESKLPYDEKLIMRCYEEVLRSRGLKDPNS
jgi:hypothetical protein